MKLLTAFLFFNFLCVWCFGFQDCEGDDLICDELSPVPAQLENAIPYQDGEISTYRFDNLTEEISVEAFRNKLEAGGLRCRDQIIAVLKRESTAPRFNIRFSTDAFEEEVLMFDFSFTSLAPEDTERFGIHYDVTETASVDPPLRLRMIADTTMEGNNYREVAVVTNPSVDSLGSISAFYYSRVDGLLRVERTSGPSFFRVD